jgi:hypothetical protein
LWSPGEIVSLPDIQLSIGFSSADEIDSLSSDSPVCVAEAFWTSSVPAITSLLLPDISYSDTAAKVWCLAEVSNSCEFCNDSSGQPPYNELFETIVLSVLFPREEKKREESDPNWTLSTVHAFTYPLNCPFFFMNHPRCFVQVATNWTY